MREQSGRRPGRFGKPAKRKGPGRKRYGGPSDGRSGDSNGYRGGNGNVNGNRANGASGEMGVCLKCGHPAPDGKLCGFHRSLLNTFRKENPEQDPRRNKFV